MNRAVRNCSLVFALASLASGAGATEGNDDLDLVKRAVAQNQVAQEASPSVATQAAPAPAREKRSPRWLKVRILPDDGEEKVSVNVPLSLVRLVGGIGVDLGCEDERKHDACGVDVMDLLDELESGQDLVEIDGRDAKIRIWVE